MDIIDFFNHDDLEVPYHWNDGDIDFTKLIEEKFNLYQSYIDGLDPCVLSNLVKSKKTAINGICNSLKSVVEQYLKGNLSEAYKIFTKMMQKNSVFLHALNSNDIAKYDQWYFRIRESEFPIHGIKENFHIESSKRHLVSSQRYSIPGLPCLYLGGSAYICWEELNKPSFDRCYISRYKVRDDQTLRVLNFGYRTATIAIIIDNIKKKPVPPRFIEAYAVLWPIIFACSVKKKYPTGKFHYEYIVPQMLMQWIATQKKFDGVRFFTTRIVEYPNAIKVNSNFAFPIRELDEDGYCRKLKDLFELTEPINMQYLLYSGVKPKQTSPNATESIQLTSKIEVIYGHTAFCDIENKLSVLDFEQI